MFVFVCVFFFFFLVSCLVGFRAMSNHWQLIYVQRGGVAEGFAGDTCGVHKAGWSINAMGSMKLIPLSPCLAKSLPCVHVGFRV